ncbi:Thioredoxin domain-containing protein [Vanrija pseudolonga]|uniref:Thioredoxin domain-containing protein n=1 Tax=Vanrija pseudolonga TaxID=143232 RepID=A0AAF0Y2R0_9TREE|nr:Thioredoxin domain-containing protein [Vanrija pseudolonga]
MPLTESTLSKAKNELAAASKKAGADPTYAIFYSSSVGGQLWCPGCRQVESVVKKSFEAAGKPNGTIVYVGNINEWKDKGNKGRTEYGLTHVPTILRLEGGKETGRLVGGQIANSSHLKALLTGGEVPRYEP